MVATLGSLAEGRTTTSTPASWDESRLVEQLTHATQQLRVLEAEGRRTEMVRAIIRSLTKTLARIAECGSIIDLGSPDFVVKRFGDEIQLWHRGRRVPVQIEPLLDALEAAGLELAPAQALLADTELVQRMVEESLVSCSLQEFRLRETKASLLRTLQDLPASCPEAAGVGKE